MRRVRTTSLITGVALAWLVAARWNLGAGIGWVLGCLWSLANLYAISLVVRATMSGGKGRNIRLPLVLLVKLPVLYGLGFFVLTIDRLPTVAVLSGFTWPLIVITLKLLGRAVLKMDRPVAVSPSGDLTGEKARRRP